MASIKARLGALTGAAALTAALAVTGATPASAEPDFKFDYFQLNRPGGGFIIDAWDGADFVGDGEWWRDPGDGKPGDTVVAYDGRADGYGIEAHLMTDPERIASTRGHAKGYEDRKSGNLREGSDWVMYVCVVKGSFHKCSKEVVVYA
ncbi:hypothetical protein ACFOZ0_07950 [Streptomyces yaanensis]|uniref:Uncharacterized protein n=1 Tax=Streptomyces yaanensis TaxID=1142239 RepID=A0ABV7S8P5_9ACTN|nr:hypothetical protein [Streptomyces sp. CGMCC 4.7035]WNC02711.1 hypothetical protein Q2K21_34220 [Streptomyces sp. CGMCC 4.7035]